MMRMHPMAQKFSTATFRNFAGLLYLDLYTGPMPATGESPATGTLLARWGDGDDQSIYIDWGAGQLPSNYYAIDVPPTLSALNLPLSSLPAAASGVVGYAKAYFGQTENTSNISMYMTVGVEEGSGEILINSKSIFAGTPAVLTKFEICIN